MYEIYGPQFSCITPLLKGAAYLSLPAIIHSTSQGRIWVDNPSNPDIALVWDSVNGFLFILKKSIAYCNNSKINVFLKDTLIPLAKKSGYDKICVFLLYDQTNTQLNELFTGFSFNTGLIDHFQLRNNVNELPITIPSTFNLVKIDDKLLNKNIVNIKEIKRCITACWPDVTEYFEEGVGYVLLKGDTAVSWCSTDYVVLNACDIYVETFNGYKQKGFGTAVSLQCVKECLEKGYEVNWHCWHDNQGSIRIAEKIGFHKKGIQNVWSITL
ncbi:MAG: GNAT family N-acetyltransferase [Candidatus Methanofastidiosia archaeon]|jgi:hypothetical protein